MLSVMSTHGEYGISGYPVNAFESVEKEPWPPNWSEEEEAQYWEHIEGETW
jgi:hypothetical protein